MPPAADPRTDPRTDPRLAPLRGVLAERPPRTAERGEGSLEAGVCLVLRPGDELELLLIERVEREGDPWSGHIALPGGMREAGDRDLLDTALRETAEEVGVRLDREGSLLGALDELSPSTRRLPPLVISPFVAAVAPGVELTLDPREVADALWAPISGLADPAARAHVELHYEGQDLRFPAIALGPHRVWGLTYRILLQLFALAGMLGMSSD